MTQADQRADTSPLPPGTQRSPRTAAGRWLLELTDKHQAAVVDLMTKLNPDQLAERIDFAPFVLAIEAEAAVLDAEGRAEPAAAEPPAPTGDNDADTQALIEAWGEPEVQAEGMSVKQWERHVADLRERATQPPRGVTPALDAERLLDAADAVAEASGNLIHWDVDQHEWTLPFGPVSYLEAIAAEYARLGSPEDGDAVDR